MEALQLGYDTDIDGQEDEILTYAFKGFDEFGGRMFELESISSGERGDYNGILEIPKRRQIPNFRSPEIKPMLKVPPRVPS